MANARIARIGVVEHAEKRRDYLSNATTAEAAIIVVAGILLIGFVFWLMGEADIMMELAREGY